MMAAKFEGINNWTHGLSVGTISVWHVGGLAFAFGLVEALRMLNARTKNGQLQFKWLCI